MPHLMSLSGVKQTRPLRCECLLLTQCRRKRLLVFSLLSGPHFAEVIQQAISFCNECVCLGDFETSCAYCLPNLVLGFYRFRTVPVEAHESLGGGYRAPRVIECKRF